MYEVQTKPKIYINLDSPDGNPFFILSHAANAMKAYQIYDVKNKIAEMRSRVSNSQSYEEALAIISEYVDIIEE